MNISRWYLSCITVIASVSLYIVNNLGRLSSHRCASAAKFSISAPGNAMQNMSSTGHYELVIARAHEDMTWLSEVQLPGAHVILYDKGHIVNQSDFAGALWRLHRLENFERESGTLLIHIITNYFNLPDFTVFMQGDPFNHMKNIQKSDIGEKIANLVASKPLYAQPLLAAVVEETSDMHPALQFNEYFKYFFSADPPTRRQFVSGCQYILPRSSILSRPIEIYLKLYGMLRKGRNITYIQAHESYRPFDPAVLNPWTFERLIWYFFRSELLSEPNVQGFEPR